jgi:hypothetical protein
MLCVTSHVAHARLGFDPRHDGATHLSGPGLMVAVCLVTSCILLTATRVYIAMQLPLLRRHKLGTAAAVGLLALPLQSGKLLREKLQLCPPASKLLRMRSSK